MARIRSVLWIGAARDLKTERVAETPSLDLAWARDVDEALELPLAGFDVLVLDAESEAAVAAARRLSLQSGAVPLLVRLSAPAAELRHALAGAGASGVIDARAPLVPQLDLLTRDAPATAPPPPRAAPPRGMVGRSAAMAKVFTLVARAQGSRATVLLSGATGTGKELLARAIHDGGDRGRGPFVAVNCAAFPDTLLESELFGHRRGAFTGAERDKPGLFEEACGGSLFLDEVGETSGPLQAKLLRVLQEREIRAVGGTKARAVDVRVVAATNRDLRFEVSNGHFREDLYYRLAVFPIAVPPLRERAEDVLPLAEHFLARIAAAEGRPAGRLTREAGHLLLSYPWPGNVRELENEMQRALALAEAGEAIDTALLSERVRAGAEPARSAVRAGESLRQSLERLEAYLLRQALARHDGRRAETARQLGITREGLYKKLKRLGIE